MVRADVFTLTNASAPRQRRGYASSKIFFTILFLRAPPIFSSKGKENFAFGVLL